MDAFFNGFLLILQNGALLYMFAGVTLGLILGALPGLTGSLGIALMLPFTYHMEPLIALVFLLSIYTGGLFGGAVTAISINTPGSPANIMTQLDGYPMYQKGQGGRALGIALLSSVIGGLIGCVFLVLATEPMANISLKFGNGEMFMVMVFGISCVGSLSKSPTKSVFSGLFGILLSTIGISTIGGVRGTFGNMFLFEGLPLVPTLIGLLALPEVMKLALNQSTPPQFNRGSTGLRSILEGFKDVVKRPIQTILCSITGVIVGIIPAAGASVASVLSYNQTKPFSKRGAQFGTGVPEGLIAAETANNASEGGALATMFVLGIPGSSSTAMMLGALALQGWAAGPKLFIDHRDVIYTAFSSLFLQQVVMLIIGTIVCMLASYIVKIPNRYLLPIILIFTLMGSYSDRLTTFDMGLMILLGIIGYLMKENNFPVLPMILGFLLGRDAESNLIRICQQYDNFLDIFKSPITVALFIVSLISFFAPLVMRHIRSKKERMKQITQKEEL
ncbi:MAG: tripartite tricarboxylate transporter permease [Bacillota bacterium]|nr:tripartite tricarboxylate transporter permease [Bacillota bacterium]